MLTLEFSPKYFYSYHSTESITLTYKDSLISFEFSALDFVTPKKRQYAYRLKGFDDEWITTTYNKRFATFTRLPSGEYELQIRSRYFDSLWDDSISSIEMTVLPPPWKTWWAYSLYGVFLLSLVLAFIHSQRKKVLFERSVNAQLESKVVERTIQLQNKTEELQKSNTILENMSLTDQMTGLKNRRFLLNNIESDIALVLRKYKSNNKPEAADLIFSLST